MSNNYIHFQMEYNISGGTSHTARIHSNVFVNIITCSPNTLF